MLFFFTTIFSVLINYSILFLYEFDMIVQQESEPLEVEFIFLSEGVRNDKNLIESKKNLNDDSKQTPNITKLEQKNEEVKLEEGKDNTDDFFF